MSGIWAIDIETLELPMDEAIFAEYEASVREELQQEAAIQKRLDKFKKDWKFTAGGSKILAFGALQINDRGEFWVCNDEEKLVVDGIKHFIRKEWPEKLVAFNGDKFDFRNIAIAISRHTPFAELLSVDYKLYDLSKKPIYQEFTSLASFARMLGIEGKNGDGSQVANYHETDKATGSQLLKEYCLYGDCRIVAEGYRKLSLFYPMY